MTERRDDHQIPWDEIDQKIKPLVRAINNWPGIETIGSCAGHKPLYHNYHEGYILFRADTIDALTKLCAALPLGVQPMRAGVSYAPQWIRGAMGKRGDEILSFILCFGGYPLNQQRDLLSMCAEKLETIC